MADNVFSPADEGMSIPVSVAPELSELNDELALSSKLAKERMKDAEAYVNILGTVEQRMQPLIQLAEQDLDLQNKLLEARRMVSELTDKNTSSVREQREEYEKLVELMTTLGGATGGAVGLPPLRVAGLADRADIINPVAHLNRDAEIFGDAEMKKTITAVVAAIREGDVSAGLSGVTAAVDKARVGGYREDAQIKAYERMVQLQTQLRDIAIDTAMTMDQTADAVDVMSGGPGVRRDGGPTPDSPAKPGLKPKASPEAHGTSSFQRRVLERLDPQLFSQKQEQQQKAAIANITKQIPVGLPGGGALQKGGAELLGMAGSKIIPVGMAAAAAGLAYDQWKDLEGSRREYTGIMGETSLGSAFGYDMQARMMGLSPFMSEADAKRIITGSMRQGYKGSTLDSSINFGSNLVSNGLTDAGSALEIFKSNVQIAGEHVDHVNFNLEALSKTAATSNTSLENLVAGMKTASETLAGIGTEEGTSSTAAQMASLYTGGAPEDVAKLAGLEKNLPGLMNNNLVKMSMIDALGTDRQHYSEAVAAATKAGTLNNVFAEAMRKRLLTMGTPEDFESNDMLVQQIMRMFPEAGWKDLDTARAGIRTFLKANLAQGVKEDINDRLAPQSQDQGWLSTARTGIADMGTIVGGTVWKGADWLNPWSSHDTDMQQRGMIAQTYHKWASDNNTSLPLFESFMKDQNRNMMYTAVMDETGNVKPISDYLSSNPEGIRNLAEGKAKYIDLRSKEAGLGEGADFTNGTLTDDQKAKLADKWKTISGEAGYTGPGAAVPVRDKDGNVISQNGGVTIALSPEASKHLQIFGSGNGEFTHDQLNREKSLRGQANQSDQVGPAVGR